MSFISILLALLLEQAKPLGPNNPVHHGVQSWVRLVLRNFDSGDTQHAWLAWSLMVVLPAGLVCAFHWLLLWSLGWVAAAVWSVAVLYATLGFRQFSYRFTGIRDALDAGDEALARQRLAQWMRLDVEALPRNEISRHVIEYSVLSAHRYVLGVLAWYTLLAAVGLGPAGAVVYRIGGYASRYVNRLERRPGQSVTLAIKTNASSAWAVIDWVPIRVTALGFAMVGSFEDAVDCWRQYEQKFPGNNDGVLLAATSGAINVKLGPQENHGSGQNPQPVHLRAVVGLVWRTVVMWMVFLALGTLARLLS